MSVAYPPASLAGASLTHLYRACAFFHADEEKYRVLDPFIMEDRPVVHDIVEYEARLNLPLPARHAPVVCTDDLSQVDADVVIGILRARPAAIIGGILQENPFFMPSEPMIAEIAARRAAGEHAAGLAAQPQR